MPAITLKTDTFPALRETRVSAYDAKGEFICCETWAGIGSRVSSALSQQVLADAERRLAHLRRPTAADATERRMLTARLV